MEKNYQFLDIEINKPIYRKLSAVQYDNNSRYILVSVYSNFKPYDLTYASVKIYGIKKDKTVFFNNAKILDAKAGKFEIDLTEQCLAVNGDVEIQILILGVNQERLSSNSFILNVKKNIIDPVKVTSQDEWGMLTEGLANLAEYDIYKNTVDRNDKQIKENIKKLEQISSIILNVKDFGATGDGFTDDSLSIKNAIKKAESLISDRFKDGVTVYFPVGQYLISETITISKSGIFLKGETITTTIINNNLNGNMFEFNGEISIYRAGMSDLTLKINSKSENSNILYLKNLINSMFYNLVVTNSYNGIKILNCGKVFFDKLNFTQENSTYKSHYAIDVNNGSDLHFSDIQIFANATPFLAESIIIRGCDGLYFCNSHWHGSVVLLPTSNNTLASIFFDNCYFDRANGACLEIQGGTTNPYRNFMFSNCYFRDGGNGVNISTNTICELIQFTGCSFTQNRLHGVITNSNVRHITFSSCIFADNNVNNGVYPQLNLSCDNSIVTGCQFIRGGENGTGLKSLGSFNLISNNNFAACNGNKISLHGSSNSIFNNNGYVLNKVGSAVIPQSNIEVVVEHNIPNITPENIMVLCRSRIHTNYWIEYVNSDSFKIVLQDLAPTGGLIFSYWINGEIHK